MRRSRSNLLVACIPHLLKIASPLPFFAPSVRAGCVPASLPWQRKETPAAVLRSLPVAANRVCINEPEYACNHVLEREGDIGTPGRSSGLGLGDGGAGRCSPRGSGRESHHGRAIRQWRGSRMARRHRTPCLERRRMGWEYGERGKWGLMPLLNNVDARFTQAHASEERRASLTTTPL